MVEPSTRTSARVVRAEITCAPVSVAELAAAVEDRAAGAVVTFDGLVRDHDGGRRVRGAAPCRGSVARSADEIAGRPGLRALAVVHRVGDLRVGDTALGVAVSADHRAPAFEAVREVVEEVKRLLPVWKRQLFADGAREWSNIA